MKTNPNQETITMKQRLTVGLIAALVLALAAFTGSALAGGGNGNGSDGSNGNSANAPGHQAPAAPPAAPQPTAAPAAAPAPAPAKQSKQSSTSASQPATGGTNSTGVKPSNSTKHDTYAKASSNQTKQYGNGKTAGQIATQAGYGDATLHGPGNSQPHKVLCGGHEVDVHALKHKGSKCGTATPSSTQGSTKAEQKRSETKSAECATTTSTVTEQVLVGVKHMIGPKGSGRYVSSTPARTRPTTASMRTTCRSTRP